MRKLLREVTYLVGNSAEKRRMLRTGGKCVARACPDEVSAVCRMGGKDYYVVGRHPFARFSVWEYMRYERALLSPSPLTKKQAREMLKGAGKEVRAQIAALVDEDSFVELAAFTFSKDALLQENPVYMLDHIKELTILFA